MRGISKEKKKILEYWIKFFPEIKIEELENIISFTDEIDIKQLINIYNDYDNIGDFEVDRFIDFEYCGFLKNNIIYLKEKLSFMPFILPIVNKQLKESKIDTYVSDLIYDTNLFWREIIVNICYEVYRNLYKTIIYEINYLSKNNFLQGKTPDERMGYFNKSYANNKKYLIKFYQEYQTVTILSFKKVKTEIEFIFEIIGRIRLHKKEVKEKFQIELGDKGIRNICLGSGDTHQNGRSVAEIVLVSGEKFYYKPHQLKIDEQFSKLLSWIEKSMIQAYDFKLPEVISEEEYGFAECIEHKECNTVEDVKRFYHRCGELLTILYALNASDIHYENIIACGEYPVIIDLETLLHPRLSVKDNANAKSSQIKAAKEYENSVVTIGMLPTYMKGKMEVGGLGAISEQSSSFKSDYIMDANNDNIHIDRRYFTVNTEKNNPILNGKAVDSELYISEIEKGFTDMYYWIENNKKEFFAKIETLFIGLTGRVVVRPTYFYGQLLNIALHQQFSRKNFERQLILYRIAIEQYKEFPEVVKEEHRDLLSGDVPYFTFIIGEDVLISSQGKTVNNCRLEPLLDEIHDKIQSFEKVDLNKQRQYIRASYITKKDVSDATKIVFGNCKENFTPEKWLKTAENIGDYIIENAIEGRNDFGNKDASWVSVTLQGFEEDVWVPSVLGNEFYNGNEGISFLFLYLWKITGKLHYLEMAKKAAEPSISFLKKGEGLTKMPIGAFVGLGGSIYALYTLAKETNDYQLSMLIKNIVIKCGQIARYDKYNDFIAGTAGCLAVLLKIGKESKDVSEKTEVNNVIAILINQLRANAKEENNMYYWECMLGKTCSGFAHGSAGIHTYIYLAEKYLRENNLEHLINGSLEYERRHFNKKENNWIRSQEEPFVSHAWCHGAPGILLSKLLLYKNGMKNELIKSEIKIGINRTIKSGIGISPTYCHGDLGNLSILREAGKVLESKEIVDKEIYTFQELYKNILSKKWREKELKSCNTYGLMIGLAGWSYALLSHYADDLPEFLWME